MSVFARSLIAFVIVVGAINARGGFDGLFGAARRATADVAPAWTDIPAAPAPDAERQAAQRRAAAAVGSLERDATAIAGASANPHPEAVAAITGAATVAAGIATGDMRPPYAQAAGALLSNGVAGFFGGLASHPLLGGGGGRALWDGGRSVPAAPPRDTRRRREAAPSPCPLPDRPPLVERRAPAN